MRGFNPRAGINPYRSWAKIIDCGDISPSPFDNALALRQMSEAFEELGARRVPESSSMTSRPRYIALGGDHSIALPELRSLSQAHKQPITVLHFDAHLDTWNPNVYDDAWLDPDLPIEEQQSAFTHGTMFWLASKEGLVANGSVHAGLRTRLSGIQDNHEDDHQGWVRIASDAISYDELGPRGIVQKVMSTIGTEKPVYLSIDIDVIDPGLAPGTGTPEPGGWTTRELVQVLRGIEDLNVVGADVVEVSPAYDGTGEQTALAGAQVVYEVLTSMVKRGLKDQAVLSSTINSGNIEDARDEL
ncbi:MAG: hypothetical protein M1828_002831 [Chrysothrix sp. TS-e1954]|nr:MAG: hypothetical protein M1828_002831 [Chrysothrix sp. TS-e1954]